MTYPRAHLVDELNGGFYHCTSRCVRRAWLCGKDPVTGASYSHRRRWLEAKILHLARFFAIDVCAYAIMSNHYHIVVRTDPRRTSEWSPEEVAKRWLSRHNNRAKSKLGENEKMKDLVAQPDRIQQLRRRLSSLSWFMRDINESLARKANAEDECTGRFWEGRFKSVALLDRRAVIQCMIYVDLNPARAKPNRSIPSPHTSARARMLQRRNRLASLSDVELSLTHYIDLLKWTHSRTRARKRTHPVPRNTLSSLGQTEEQWLKNVRAHSDWYRAYGLPESIAAYVKKIRQRWIQMPALRASRIPVG